MSDVAAPQAAQDEPQPELGTDTPLSVVDAWGDVLVAISRVEPQDALSRAVGAAARASIRQATERQPITQEIALAFSFMQTLGEALTRLEHRKAEGAAEVMRVLFSARQPPPSSNGAFGGP